MQHVPLARFFSQTPTVRNPRSAVRQRTQPSANIAHPIAERVGVAGIPASDLLRMGRVDKGIEIYARGSSTTGIAAVRHENGAALMFL